MQQFKIFWIHGIANMENTGDIENHSKEDKEIEE